MHVRRRSPSTNKSWRGLSALVRVASVLLPCLTAAQGFPGPALARKSPGLAVLGRQDLPATTVRVGVDVIAVDVQVIDRDGRPVAGLGPDKFEVTMDGRRRRVVSAEFVASHRAGTPLAPPAGPPGILPPEGGSHNAYEPPSPGSASHRVIVLAVDCLSFSAGVSRGAMEAARGFIARLPPADSVGLFAYPSGPKVDPTTDHASVIHALDSIVGQRETSALSQFHLRPSEIIDVMAAVSAGGQQSSAIVDTVLKRECGDPIDGACGQRLMLEITGDTLFYEGQANARLGMLRSLLREMGSVSGRKTLVLVSGGMVASDVPGGRPDLNVLGTEVGKEAARANTAIYTLYIDSSFLDRFSAETRTADKNLVSLERDSAVLGRWLEQFSGAAGGALFKVLTGNGESAFDRILTETSSYYVLGIEPAESDRDGRTREIRVKANARQVTVRGGRWVAVPSRGARVVNEPAAAITPVPSVAPAALPPAAAPSLRAAPIEVKALADAFDRGDYEGMHRGLTQTRSLANLIRDFRTSDSPWPEGSHRAAVFALELAVAGLRSDHGESRNEGGRLLVEYGTRIRQPRDANAFECSWLWTQVTALEGLFMGDSAMLFVPRAVQRCPNEPRLHLAYAIVSEQQWIRGGQNSSEGNDIMRRYEQAMAFPETEAEARLRAAWFLYRTGKIDRALALCDGPVGLSTDRHVRYLRELVRGQVLRAANRSDDAVSAFRAALTIWPGAQSATVALMTLLVNRGEHQEAAALAEAAETATDDQFDPWWTYWLGDYRAYPAIIAGLRGLGR